jgi:hypothetical protein
MKKLMSLSARREMLDGVRNAYNKAAKPEKTKILDGFAAATGYDRKYAIQLLSKNQISHRLKAHRSVLERKYTMNSSFMR